MAVTKGDGYTVRSQVWQAVDRIGDKARFSLLAVADDWGAGRFELLYRVPDRVLEQDIETLALSMSHHEDYAIAVVVAQAAAHPRRQEP